MFVELQYYQYEASEIEGSSHVMAEKVDASKRSTMMEKFEDGDGWIPSLAVFGTQ